MKYETRKVDIERGIVQITTCDERWYEITHPETGKTVYYPSVTWIAEHYPKGIGFYKWLANTGWDEAEALKRAAGDKGSRVHQACECLEEGRVLKIDSLFLNSSDIISEEELTIEEWECAMSFRDWLDNTRPELIECEKTCINSKEEYAGTLDRIYKINGELWIVDLKTSQYIWPSHEIQVSAYAKTDIKPEEYKLGILQLGYRKNKLGYKFTQIEDKYELFLHAKAIWANENPNSKPKQKDYPLTIQAECRKREVKGKEHE